MLVAAVCVVGITCGYTRLKSEGIICDLPYVLCTSAHCIPDPSNPNHSICFCEVKEGKSYGHTPCNDRQHAIDSYGIKHLTSTFSFGDFDTKKNMTCPDGNPWSDCLDQPCIVDPLDPKKAICLCKIVRTGAFQTFGGECDTATCDTGYWSGATPQANAVGVQTVMKAMGLTESPQRFCPK